ncbi:MAG: YihA family ribosome biogenesis GTP-binding protein [Firmicutes bacterium]|nr:YihA family ribosome biogenesis GTP-binding protein [Bacillota bacterium]
MNIRHCELERIVGRPQELPRGVFPEVGFLGRSNVGKSSLINVFLGRKNLARTSSTPGKTKALFFYLVNDSFYLVDFPGYGYARVSKGLKKNWGYLIESYLEQREQLKGLVHIIDIRHLPTEDDRQMMIWLLSREYPFLTVATKADKISRGRSLQQIKKIRAALELPREFPLVTYSSRSRVGAETVNSFITQLVSR